MALMSPSQLLLPRYVECVNGFCSRRRSPFFTWILWFIIGIIGLALLVVLFVCSCCARRRRRRGMQPMYGTGWMAPAGKFGPQNTQEMHGYQQGYNGQGYAPQGYDARGYGQAGGYPPPPPAYGYAQQPQNTGTTFHGHDGYYQDPSQLPQQYGVQQPPAAYQPSGPYEPPPGPPPTK